jgi:hypothetical protein
MLEALIPLEKFDPALMSSYLIVNTFCRLLRGFCSELLVICLYFKGDLIVLPVRLCSKPSNL